MDTLLHKLADLGAIAGNRIEQALDDGVDVLALDAQGRTALDRMLSIEAPWTPRCEALIVLDHATTHAILTLAAAGQNTTARARKRL